VSDRGKRMEDRAAGYPDQDPWFGVLLQKVTQPDGSTSPYYTIDFPNRAVGVVVSARGMEFLFIRQYRFIVDEHVWAIPSGRVPKRAKAPADCRRPGRWREETGYRPSKPPSSTSLGY